MTTVNVAVPLADERLGVERRDDRPFFPGLERRLGDRGRRAAAARPHVGDVDVFLVEVLDLEGELGLGPAGDVAEVVAGRGEHLAGPLLGRSGRGRSDEHDEHRHSTGCAA